MQMEVGYRTKTCEEAINTILTVLIKKNVQVNYSGLGRKTVNGVKQNFSATFTFKCLADSIKLKFQLESENSKKLKISSVVGHFLAGASDREDGANERKKQALLRAMVDKET